MLARRSSTSPWPDEPPDERHRRSYSDAEPRPFWLDRPDRPGAAARLEGPIDAGLAIVGAGLSGLWAAVQAKEEDPGRDVVLLEAETVAFGASGRNGGFIQSSLTHGLANGLSRFPEEMQALERLGMRNFGEIRDAVARHGIECDLELTGDLTVALEPHEERWLAEEAEEFRRFGHEAALLDREAVRAEVDSPLYRAGLWVQTGAGLVDPARLAWGLRRVALELGVRLFEGTPVTAAREAGAAVVLVTPAGRVRAERVLLATSAYSALVPAVRRRIVPVWDYVLVSEPLGAERRAAVGWRNRQGIGDSANQFHYYRLTSDDRILWGGYDAVYEFRNGVAPRFEQRDATFAKLAQHFFHTFPQLEGLRFTHRWGGAIDTCSRFSVFFGRAHGGRSVYLAGHTGLGVGASRWSARVALDLLDGRDTEATRLRYVRTQPTPFPPEPLRWAVIQLTRNRLAAADRRQGRRGAWLRLLDRLGLGYDS